MIGLDINKPKTCQQCPCKQWREDGEYLCNVAPDRNYQDSRIDIFEPPPDWCPIIPLKDEGVWWQKGQMYSVIAEGE